MCIRDRDIVVVLACYIHVPGFKILYGVVPAVMTEFQLFCFAAECKPDYLVPHADAAYGIFSDKSLYCVGCSRSVERVAGAV